MIRLVILVAAMFVVFVHHLNNATKSIPRRGWANSSGWTNSIKAWCLSSPDGLKKEECNLP